MKPFKAFNKCDYKNLRGYHCTGKHQFAQPWDSHFEEKQMYGLDFNESVITYATQCVSFNIPKKTRRYTPDAMVIYNDGSVVLQEFKPEVKLDEEMEFKLNTYGDYIRNNSDWDFKIVTERAYTDTQMLNYIDLSRFLKIKSEYVVDFCRRNKAILTSTPNIQAIRESGFSDEIKSMLWACISYGFGKVDLNKPFTDTTKIAWEVR